MAARKGRAAPRQDVAQDRRAAQIYRLERVAGRGIIGEQRKNSAHFRRPWRARFQSLSLISESEILSRKHRGSTQRSEFGYIVASLVARCRSTVRRDDEVLGKHRWASRREVRSSRGVDRSTPLTQIRCCRRLLKQPRRPRRSHYVAQYTPCACCLHLVLTRFRFGPKTRYGASG